MVFLFPPSPYINDLISCNDSVIRKLLVDSEYPNPSNIPAAIAITFLIDPHNSTPSTSDVSLSFIESLSNTFLIKFIVVLFLLAIVNPIGS